MSFVRRSSWSFYEDPSQSSYTSPALDAWQPPVAAEIQATGQLSMHDGYSYAYAGDIVNAALPHTQGQAVLRQSLAQDVQAPPSLPPYDYMKVIRHGVEV